jgi:hypothetical protein
MTDEDDPNAWGPERLHRSARHWLAAAVLVAGVVTLAVWGLA